MTAAEPVALVPVTMSTDVAAALRAPFPAAVVGKLPRVWCGACRDARGKCCDRHRKVKCQGCRNNITEAHVHLDYVGHAETTDRLLSVDPGWSWEPLAWAPDGLPLFDGQGGLWIRLTVAGVTRLGYGDADGKRGASAVKEAIGDAIRNAAMRFGVALDLWGATFKAEAEAEAAESRAEAGRQADADAAHADAAAAAREITSAQRSGGTGRTSAPARQRDDQAPAADPGSAPRINPAQQRRMHALFNECEITDRADRLAFTSQAIGRDVASSNELTVPEASALIDRLIAYRAQLNPDEAGVPA